MFEFFELASLMDWLALTAMVLMGGFAGYGVFDRERKKREKEGDEADDRLISLLKGTVESLEKQVNKMQSQVSELSTKVQKLQTENDMLRGILQGRDSNTKKIQDEMVENIQRNKETLATVKEISSANKTTNENIEKLYELMNRHLECVEKLIQE